MPPSDSTQRSSSTAISVVASVAGVAVCYAVIEWGASLHLLARIVPLPPSLSPRLIALGEHHVWQFSLAMLTVMFLSRGHLWSYGINSSDIRLSMSMLLKFYVVAAVIMMALIVAPLFISPVLPDYMLSLSRVDMIGWILFQWMAAAVADEILFHGLFQTLLLKYWRQTIVIGSYDIPVAIFVTSIAFAAGRTNVPIYGNALVEFFLATMIGLFGGIVYYRTRSLLTPMLAQAFFYGLPFVIRYVYFTLAVK